MLFTVLIGLAVAAAVLAVVVSLRPSEFSVTRSAIIAAPPSALFPHTNELRKWNEWSPWAKLDPNAENSFSGPAAGVGSSFAWAGDRNVGAGSMTIVDSRPHELVRLRLDFLKPMKASNIAEFTFVPEAGGTRVTWTMSGRNNFMAKGINLVIDCDKMVGDMFEKGLASLKRVVEAEARG